LLQAKGNHFDYIALPHYGNACRRIYIPKKQAVFFASKIFS